MRIEVIIGIIAALIVGVLLFNGMSTEREASPPDEQPLPSKGGRGATITVVKMRNFTFEPNVVRIQPGGTVRWVIEEGSHSITAYHPENDRPLRIPKEAESWNSGILSGVGKTFERTFTTEGVYDYYCIPHEGLGMVGIVVVGEPKEGPGLSPPQGDLPEKVKEKLEELMDQAKMLGQ